MFHLYTLSFHFITKRIMLSYREQKRKIAIQKVILHHIYNYMRMVLKLIRVVQFLNLGYLPTVVYRYNNNTARINFN